MVNAETTHRTKLLTFGWSDWMMAGFVLILVGYFLPWFKLPAAGLTLIGLDISEWLKFMPQFDSGELPNRNWFYLPPICLGAMIILWSALVGAEGKRRWILTGLGLLLALIAFPALEVLPIDGAKFAATNEWLFRFVGIGLVGLLAVSQPFWAKSSPKIVAVWIALIALGAALFPAYLLYLSRSAYIFWLRLTPNPGLGFGMHILGVVLILIGAYTFIRESS